MALPTCAASSSSSSSWCCSCSRGQSPRRLASVGGGNKGCGGLSGGGGCWVHSACPPRPDAVGPTRLTCRLPAALPPSPPAMHCVVVTPRRRADERPQAHTGDECAGGGRRTRHDEPGLPIVTHLRGGRGNKGVAGDSHRAACPAAALATGGGAVCALPMRRAQHGRSTVVTLSRGRGCGVCEGSWALRQAPISRSARADAADTAAGQAWPGSVEPFYMASTCAEFVICHSAAVATRGDAACRACVVPALVPASPAPRRIALSSTPRPHSDGLQNDKRRPATKHARIQTDQLRSVN